MKIDTNVALKAGLIGCGARGSGAAVDFLKAGPNLKIAALADVFEDRIKDCRERLAEEMDHEVADDQCFVGFDAYKRLLDADVDLVLRLGDARHQVRSDFFNEHAGVVEHQVSFSPSLAAFPL